MAHFDYALRDPGNGRATLGLVVLQADETIETDFRRLLPAERAVQYVSRVPSGLEVTGDTLGEMRKSLPAAAGLFPRAARFDVVGYACTSGTAVIGAARVAELVGAGCETARVTEPVSALVAACRHLGVSRLALLSPYVAPVSDRLRAVLAEAGVQTPVFGSFDEAEEARVARIDGESITAAALELGAGDDAQALFLSCTNLAALDVIAGIEAAVGKPVLSSNTVLAWHMCRLAGVRLRLQGFGRLLAG